MKTREAVRRTLIGAAVVTVVTLAASPARAQPITFRFTGAITQFSDPTGLLDGSVAVGTPFAGTYTFDASTPDSNPDPTVGDYWHRAPGYGIHVDVGTYVFETDPNAVQFLIEVVKREQHNYLLRSYYNLPIPGCRLVDHISWQLDDPSGTALANKALPLTPPYLPAWQSFFGLSLDGSGGGTRSFFIRGHVDAISDDAAPGPAIAQREIRHSSGAAAVPACSGSVRGEQH